MEVGTEAKKLQDDLALIDMLSRPGSGGRYTEFLVKKLQNLKIKMYQEKGHSMPHVHIDYGKQKHSASYSIQSFERLAGNLSRKYDAKVKSWIEENQSRLLDLWKNTQSGEVTESVIAEIQGNT